MTPGDERDAADGAERSPRGRGTERAPASEEQAPDDGAGGSARTVTREESGDPTDGAPLAEESLGESRRLDGAVRVQWVVGTAVASVVAAVGTAVVFRFLGAGLGVSTGGSLPLGFGRPSVAVGLGSFVVFLGVATLRAVLLYRSWRYEVREDSLYLTRGVLTRVGTVAPYVRVQHIDTRRSPVERFLGLSSLVVYTAGSRGADVTIPGLTDDRAAELQRRLKLLAIETEEEDAV